ncbi:thioredoxin domain-containing protein [Pseudenhygromyxa sp. WMMC2535]|uniref:DsbA family protein n=1 Tax=Pseudenhygromyxa sp. WMMC2535 TaxID=2712867 RepID=UPI00155170F9|nr:thioredoxin domain-containing protein [Pseudenhygromyxa sp. WMMC2535]NVB43212.1 thioredoxin domain-containing protein [Pseudenhygromyxa sp. WMMC2535]
MRPIRELLDRSSLALALTTSVVLATTACSACTPPGPDQPNAAGDRGPQTAQGSEPARTRKELDTPPEAEMIREAKGVDLSKLDEVKTNTFYTMINRELSACDEPHSLATSLRDDEQCRNSMIVAQFIADSLAKGATPSDIKIDIDAVVEALTPAEIDNTGRPTYGNENAPVTVTMFADFECPHCKAEAPVVRKAVQQYRGKAKLVFRNFPLRMHARAEYAARACEAAHLQGKFWEMHDQVFDHQTQLEDEDLERYAAQIPGLDLAKWKADYASEAVELAVAKDRKVGEALDIQGTPAVYVNGRQLSPLLWNGELSMWIDDALRRPE